MNRNYLAGAFVSFISWLLHKDDAPWAETFVEFMRGSQESNLFQMLFSGSSGYVAGLPSLSAFVSGFVHNYFFQAQILTLINCAWLGIVTVGLLKTLNSNFEQSKFWQIANGCFSVVLVTTLTMHPSLFSITSSAYLGLFPAFLWCLDKLGKTQDDTESSAIGIHFSIIVPFFIAALSKPTVIVIPISICLYFFWKKIPALSIIAITVAQFLLSNSKQADSVLDVNHIVAFMNNALLLVWNSLVFAGGNAGVAAIFAGALIISILARMKSSRSNGRIAIFFISSVLLSITPWIAYKDNALQLSQTLMKAQYLSLTFFVIIATTWFLTKESSKELGQITEWTGVTFLSLLMGVTLINQFEASKSLDARGIPFRSQEGQHCKITAPLPGWDLQISDALGGSTWTNCANERDFSAVIRNQAGNIVGFKQAEVAKASNPEWILYIYPRHNLNKFSCVLPSRAENTYSTLSSDPFVYILDSPLDKQELPPGCDMAISSKSGKVGRILLYR